MIRHFVHHALPLSRDHFGMMRGEIGSPESEIEERLPMALVRRKQQAFGLCAILVLRLPRFVELIPCL